MFSDIFEFYKFVEEIIDQLHQADEEAWEIEFKDAMASGSTSGEILGNLRLKFVQFQKTGTAKRLDIENKITIAIDYLDKVLGHR